MQFPGTFPIINSRKAYYTTQRKVQEKYILKEELHSYTERTRPSEVARRKSDVTEEHSDAMESQPLSQSKPLAKHIFPGGKFKDDAILTGSGWMWLRTQTLPLLFVQHVFSPRRAGSLSAPLSCSPSSIHACIRLTCGCLGPLECLVPAACRDTNIISLCLLTSFNPPVKLKMKPVSVGLIH